VRPAALAAALVAAALLATAGALAGQEPGHDPEGGAPGESRGVMVTDRRVVPSSLVVRPGTRIVWTNAGNNRHTVTSGDGLFDSGTLIHEEQFAILAPAERGIYGYYCRFHPFIRGSLRVSSLELTAPAVVAFNRPAALIGSVPGAPAGTAVRVERRVPGRWETLAELLTDEAGGFRTRSPRLTSSTAFRAVTDADASPSARVGVRPLATVVLRGARLEGRVTPARAGAEVLLERLNLDTYRWSTAGSRRLRAGGRVTFRLGEPGVYRLRIPMARPGLAEAVTKPVEHQPARLRG
jgi:plastocyanin